VNLGAVAVAAFIPVATVIAVPAEGKVPALKEPSVHSSVKISSETVAVIVGKVQEGKVPALPKGLMEAVLGVTVIVGAATLPAGVY